MTATAAPLATTADPRRQPVTLTLVSPCGAARDALVRRREIATALWSRLGAGLTLGETGTSPGWAFADSAVDVQGETIRARITFRPVTSGGMPRVLPSERSLAESVGRALAPLGWVPA